MINTIIFDIGMVLADFRWQKYIEEFNFSSEVNEVISNAMVLSEAWGEFDRSLLSDEEILNLFIKNAPEYKSEIIQVFENIGNAIVTYDYTKTWIRELKQNGYKVYILSNYPKKTYDLTRKQLDFIEECDGTLFSFEVKLIKPEIEIFKTLTNKYNINAQESVFLDDNKNNIEAAKQLGFKTIHFSTRKSALEELNEIFRKY
ncbi:MAG: HAD family hydrolase [Lachnotalea sp.]